MVELLKTRPGHETLAMIGVGATDMEARPPADIFIGFGGNAVREKVKNGTSTMACILGAFLPNLYFKSPLTS